MTIEGRHAVALWSVRERYSLICIFRKNLYGNIPVAESDGPLHHPARSLFNRSRPANGLQILVEQFVRRRPTWLLAFRRLAPTLFDFLRLALARFGLACFTQCCLRLFRHHRRHSYGIGAASVTGITSDFAMSLKVVLIDGEHHLHHLARCLLWLLVVLFERAFHVAELALHAQGRRDELHSGN